MTAAIVNPERARYEHLWGNVPEYRSEAPGTNHVPVFLERARPHRGARVIDFGCGTGRASRDLWIMGDVKPVMLDFAENCLDPGGKLAVALGQMEFHVADLTQPIEHSADFGYCTDVMEHIAPGDVATVLKNVLIAAKRVFFAISTVPDHFGEATDGHPLHLTVQPHAWWKLHRCRGAVPPAQACVAG